MESDLAARIRANPSFTELEARRGRFGWTLAIIMMVIYFAFIFAVAYLPDVLDANIGGVITLAFPLGLGVILSAIIITGIYVVRANGRFDTLTRRIVEQSR